MAGAPILMPKLGLTMTEGLLAEWKVAPGDTVTAGEVIFVVETDKISNEIEASAAGVIGALLVAEGETVPVGAMVATMGETTQTPSSRVIPQPAAATAATHRIIATPLARRRATKAGIDLATLSGSGPRGRIMAQDVTTAPVAAAPAPNTIHELGAYQRVAARRLTEAKRDIPHFYVFADADVTSLLALREELNADPLQARLSVNAFVIAAVARTLRGFPEMNRVWAGDALRTLPTIDLGMAVEGPKGLVAPVLRALGGLTLDEVAQAAEAMIASARAGKLSSRDLEGGAVAISNVGMFGVSGLLPIINPGQSSILGVGAAQPAFRPDASGAPVLRQMLHLALSCDHRVIDGALAARFLQALCRRLEAPAALLRRPSQES